MSNTTMVIKIDELISEQRKIIENLETLILERESRIESEEYHLKMNRQSIADSLDVIAVLEEGIKQYQE